jgi:hypothetical protein
MKSKNSKELDGIISQMLKPLKGISLNVVIEGLSGCKIIPFDIKNKKDKELLDTLKKVVIKAGKEVNKTGIVSSRPNEVGNDIEPFVKNALNEFNMEAYTPLTIDGKHKSTGYPDIEFIDINRRTNYLECKTFNIDNVDTSQRSFYLSPSEDFKITKDAHHFVISYEIYVAGRSGSNNIYKCKSWKLITLENLECDVKYEFNSDNKRLYDPKLLLAEGKI